MYFMMVFVLLAANLLKKRLDLLMSVKIEIYEGSLFCWKVLVTSRKYLYTVLFLIWALPSRHLHITRSIWTSGSLVSTFFRWEYVYGAEEVIKLKGLRYNFRDKQRAFVCTCVETHVGTLLPTYLCLVRQFFLLWYLGFYRCVSGFSFVFNTLYILKQRKVYLLIYWKLFMQITFLWRTETKPTHSCPKEETVLEFQPGYAVLSFRACVSAFSTGFLFLHLWILCTLLDAPLTWRVKQFLLFDIGVTWY